MSEIRKLPPRSRSGDVELKLKLSQLKSKRRRIRRRVGLLPILKLKVLSI